ncbi:MAG: hypothetical protein IPI15_14715 [Saprospiraceae bacterium]|uniref:hypothetical protein n=1 Tax=Candidatus Brachybacter algidus TaxID=2982024 RepID=UPI00257B98C3|nr:hypothetical protein [Candidatus Brachybacter algidus]MBK7604799.1 hypothetical protein [Candidatus Brachybacter algidus]
MFGEVDIIKTLQLKAGVSSGSEGSTGLYVRGGAGDQNLIMLGEANVYNANHLLVSSVPSILMLLRMCVSLKVDFLPNTVVDCLL